MVTHFLSPEGRELRSEVFAPFSRFYLTTQPSILNAYYPVGFANELGPALNAIHSIGVDRLPCWSHRFLAEFHASLSRSTVGLSRIAVDASQYAVRPG